MLLFLLLFMEILYGCQYLKKHGLRWKETMRPRLEAGLRIRLKHSQELQSLSTGPMSMKAFSQLNSMMSLLINYLKDSRLLMSLTIFLGRELTKTIQITMNVVLLLIMLIQWWVSLNSKLERLWIIRCICSETHGDIQLQPLTGTQMMKPGLLTTSVKFLTLLTHSIQTMSKVSFLWKVQISKHAFKITTLDTLEMDMKIFGMMKRKITALDLKFIQPLSQQKRATFTSVLKPTSKELCLSFAPWVGSH